MSKRPGESGAAGTIAIAIQVSNSSTHTCTLRGYPSFTLTSHSASMSMDVAEPVTLDEHTFTGGVFGAPVTTVTLLPGGHGGFLLAYAQYNTAGTSNCPIATKLHLTLPGSTTAAVAAVQIPVCGEPMHISPYVPGTSLTL